MSQTRYLTSIPCLMMALCGAVNAAGEVVHAGAGGFMIKHSVEIKASPMQVYSSIVTGVAEWWSPAHTYSHDTKNLSIDARPDGCFCERWKEGEGVRHMVVVYADAGKILRMSGALGPLQGLGVAGAMTWKMTEANGQTRLELAYNVGGYAPEGLDKWATQVDSVLSEQISRLKRFIETGRADSQK